MAVSPTYLDFGDKRLRLVAAEATFAVPSNCPEMGVLDSTVGDGTIEVWKTGSLQDMKDD